MPLAPPEEAPDPRCERCLQGDPELERNPLDSSWACVECGTVAQLTEIKSQARAGNCKSSEDKSRVGDDPPAQTAQEAEYQSWRQGPESDVDRRRREMAHVGGTRMTTEKLKRKKLIDAQNAIDKEAKRNAEEMLRMDGGPDQGRRKKIVRALEAVFDQIPHLDERVRDHVRREAIRVYSNSMKHEEACGRKSCMLALSQRTNIVIAYGAAEYALEVLADPKTAASTDVPGSPVTTIASLAPEWSEKEVQTQLRLLNDVQVRHSNQVLRMQVHSAISIIAEWEHEDEMCTPCDDCTDQAPDILRLPPAVVGCPQSYGRAAGADPGDVALKLRERLVATAQTTLAPANTRDTALAQLHIPETVTFLTESGLPLDIISMSLLAASALKWKDADPTASLRRHYIPRHNVSETTVREFIEQLVGLIKVPRATDSLHDIF